MLEENRNGPVFEVTDLPEETAASPPRASPPHEPPKPPDGARPTLQQIEREIARESGKYRFRRALRAAAYTILVIAALAVLISTFVLPVMKVYGNGMEPTIGEEEIVALVKRRSYKPGDIVGLYFNNRILLRRVVCVGSESFDIDEAGNVFVNGEYYDEPYLSEKSYDTTDIELPFKVPEGHYFVLADNRAKALDSRTVAVGTVTREQIAGKVLFSVWPLRTVRAIH
ncbi:MAG: signal peptidase I [Clostridia bacterium]|nr:signal peptidase I [Clostridia bacterium]